MSVDNSYGFNVNTCGRYPVYISNIFIYCTPVPGGVPWLAEDIYIDRWQSKTNSKYKFHFNTFIIHI